MCVIFTWRVLWFTTSHREAEVLTKVCDVRLYGTSLTNLFLLLSIVHRSENHTEDEELERPERRLMAMNN